VGHPLARELTSQLEETGHRFTHLIQDRDAKFHLRLRRRVCLCRITTVKSARKRPDERVRETVRAHRPERVHQPHAHHRPTPRRRVRPPVSFAAFGQTIRQKSKTTAFIRGLLPSATA
jgi:hypothetical protein